MSYQETCRKYDFN